MVYAKASPAVPTVTPVFSWNQTVESELGAKGKRGRKQDRAGQVFRQGNIM